MLSTGEQRGKRVALFLIPRILTEKFIKNFPSSFKTIVDKELERHLSCDRECNWIEISEFNLPAELFILRLLDQ